MQLAALDGTSVGSSTSQTPIVWMMRPPSLALQWSSGGPITTPAGESAPPLLPLVLLQPAGESATMTRMEKRTETVDLVMALPGQVP